MAPCMLGQMVAPHEAPVTHGTGEFLLPGVGAAMSGKFIGAGKPSFAAFPATAERFLSWNKMKDNGD